MQQPQVVIKLGSDAFESDPDPAFESDPSPAVHLNLTPIDLRSLAD